MIEVGGTYTGKNGHKWLCIAVDGEYAYMAPRDYTRSAAYCFKTDGTNISQGGGDWSIYFGPDRRTINVQGSFVMDDIHDVPMTYHHTFGEHIFNMTIDMVDGEPDWSSAKLTGA